jgi:hypothetical protein
LRAGKLAAWFKPLSPLQATMQQGLFYSRIDMLLQPGARPDEKLHIRCMFSVRKKLEVPIKILRKFANKYVATNVYIDETNRFQKILKIDKEKVQ